MDGILYSVNDTSQFAATAMVFRALVNLCTAYMIFILLRWTGPFIQFEMDSPRWRWMARLTDPLLNLIRRLLPPLGPIDLSPLVALFMVWLARQIVLLSTVA